MEDTTTNDMWLVKSDQIQKAWDRLYSRELNRGIIRRNREAWKIVADHAKGKVLEVGCGPGELVNYLNHQEGIQAVGVDISRVAIKWAVLHNGQNFKLCDVNEGLKVKKGVVDTIIALNVLEHIRDTEKFINEIKSLCRKQIIVGIKLIPSRISKVLPQWQFTEESLDLLLPKAVKYKINNGNMIIAVWIKPKKEREEDKKEDKKEEE